MKETPSYRLVAIDLDQTLLHSRDHAVSAANMAAVRRIAARGVTVTLASGRRYYTIAEFAGRLNLPQGTPLIAYNGALVQTLAGETLFHQPLPPDAATVIVHFCAEHGYHLNYYLNDEWYICEETNWSHLYQQRTGSVPHITHDLTLLDGQSPTKLLIIDTPVETDRLTMYFRDRFGDTLYITKTEDEYLEFMDAGVSKGAALARIALSLGIGREYCVAFGDSYNDIPMLEWAGLGVAMGNARPSVQAVADRIALSADDDGVAVMLDQLFPNGL